jgi:hypothetical protein
VTALGASVPETTVDENRDTLAGKEEVRASRHVFRTNLPTHNSISDQVCSEAQFRGSVRARLDCLHVAASLCCGFEAHRISKLRNSERSTEFGKVA